MVFCSFCLVGLSDFSMDSIGNLLLKFMKVLLWISVVVLIVMLVFSGLLVFDVVVEWWVLKLKFSVLVVFYFRFRLSDWFLFFVWMCEVFWVMFELVIFLL